MRQEMCFITFPLEQSRIINIRDGCPAELPLMITLPFMKNQCWMKTLPAVPEGDFVAKKTNMYYVSVDPSGKLGWKSDTLTYIDTTAHVIEVLTEKASNAYKAFMRSLGISYIIAGKEELDYATALEKLKNLFGIKTLMLGGGGVLNWSFIQSGMCDEISVVIAPCADGSSETPALFSTRSGLSADKPVGFELQSAEVKDGGSVWLRYLVKNQK